MKPTSVKQGPAACICFKYVARINTPRKDCDNLNGKFAQIRKFQCVLSKFIIFRKNGVRWKLNRNRMFKLTILYVDRQTNGIVSFFTKFTELILISLQVRDGRFTREQMYIYTTRGKFEYSLSHAHL